MDENVVGEGNCKRSYLTPVAKSDVIVTESQPSELDNAAEKYEADKCGHFSIRGYVAEVRRKDRKICWPFPTIGNHNKLEEQTLPPLHVPEFRWWHCQNCLRKNDAKETPIETGVVTNYFNRPCKTKTLALPGIPSTLSSGDVQKLHSGFQQSSEVNIVDGRKFSSDVSFRVNDDKNWPPLFGNKKEKGDEVVHPIMEDIHKLNDGISGKNLAICRSTYSLDKVDTCLAGVNFTKGGTFSTGFQIGNNGGGLSSSETAIATPSNSYEKRALETVTLKSKGYELVTNFSEIFQKETETLKSKCELVNNSKEIFHTEMPALSRTNLAQINAGNRDVLIPSVVSDVDKEVSNAVMGQTRKLHSLLSIDSSSESDENLAGEDVQDQHHASRRSNSGDTSHGSKPRKLCSLTDIIRREVLATSNKLDHTERDAKTDHMKTAGAQSKATPEASPGMSVYPVTNNQVAFQGTDKKVMLSKKKKCKLPQDQDGRSSRMSKQSGVTENIKILKEESEIKIMDTINANGELTGDASSQIGLHPGSKSFLGKHKNDKNLILGGEKKDMSQVEDILSSLAHHQDGSSNKVEIRKDAEIKCAGSELVPIKSFQDAIAGKDLNAGAQVYVAVEQNGKKLALGKKKNKVLQVEGEKSSIIPWQEGMSEKDLIMKRLQERRKNNGVLSDSLNSDGQAGMSQQDLIVKRLRERRKNNDVLSDSLNSDSQEGMSQQDWIVKRILERRKNNGVLSDSQDSKSQKDLIVKRLQERRKNNSVQSDSLNSSGQESMSQQDLIVKRLRERRKNNDVLSDSLNSDSQEGMSQLDRIVKRILERRKNNGVLSDSQDSMSQKDLIMKRLQERRKNNSVLSDSLNSDGQEGMSQQDLIVKRLRERRKNNDVLSDSLNSDGQEGMSQQDRIVKRLLERRKNNGVLSDSLNSDGQEGMSRRDRVVKRLRERRKNNDVLSDSLNSDSQEGMSPQDRIVKRLLESGKNNDVLSDSLNSDNQEGMSQKDLIVKRLLERRKNNSVLSDSLNSVQVSFTGKGVHHGLKCHLQTHRKATLNKRRKNLPQVECGVTIPGSESVSFPLICQPKDSSNACNYETAAVKEPSKLSMDQCDQMANNMCEQEASDDIPMEIVELMARNQYERRLYYARDATENRHCFSETSEKDKDTGLMDSTEALGNGMFRLLHEKSNLQKSLSSNAKDGIGSGPSAGPTKQKSDAFLSTVDEEYYNINFSTSQLEQPQASGGFKAFPERQGKLHSQVPFPFIGSRRSCGTENCTRDGDVVGNSCFGTSVQSLGVCHTSQKILQQSSIRESQSIWSTVPCRMPFESNSSQKLVAGVSIPNRLSQPPDPFSKGNVNWDHTLKPLNLEASHLQKKKVSSEMETNKGAHSEYRFACTDKGNVYHPKTGGPLDLYSNETVSAMHLLRLMHAGVCSNASVNMNNNLERFLKDSPFPHDQIINESPGLEASVSKSNVALVNLSSCDYHSKSHDLGNSCERFPPVSIVKAADSLVQKDVSFKRDAVFTDGFLSKALPGALKYQERRDKKRSYSSAQTQGPKLHTSARRNSRTSENHEYKIHDPQKGFLLLPASDPRHFPEQSQTAEGSTRHVEPKVRRKDEKVAPVERISGIESCTLNRNPADFTVPEAGNVYMIGARHLKRKWTPSRERGGSVNMDVHKRPKKMKLTTIKEHEQL